MDESSISYLQELEPSVAQAIGELVAVWSTVDWLFILALCDLVIGKSLKANEMPTLTVPFVGMGTRTLAGLLETTTKMRLPKAAAAETRKIVKNLITEKGVRDFVCHALWYEGHKPKFMMAEHSKTVGGLRTKSEHLSSNELYASKRRVLALGEEFIDLLQRHGYLAELHRES